jgi:hypothetical protein
LVTLTVPYAPQDIRDAVTKSGRERGAAECNEKLGEPLSLAFRK